MSDPIQARILTAQIALSMLGDAWRGDWSEFDGRTLRDQLCMIRDNVLTGKMTAMAFAENVGICRQCHDWLHAGRCTCKLDDTPPRMGP